MSAAAQPRDEAKPKRRKNGTQFGTQRRDEARARRKAKDDLHGQAYVAVKKLLYRKDAPWSLDARAVALFIADAGWDSWRSIQGLAEHFGVGRSRMQRIVGEFSSAPGRPMKPFDIFSRDDDRSPDGGGRTSDIWSATPERIAALSSLLENTTREDAREARQTILAERRKSYPKDGAERIRRVRVRSDHRLDTGAMVIPGEPLTAIEEQPSAQGCDDPRSDTETAPRSGTATAPRSSTEARTIQAELAQENSPSEPLTEGGPTPAEEQSCEPSSLSHSVKTLSGASPYLDENGNGARNGNGRTIPDALVTKIQELPWPHGTPSKDAVLSILHNQIPYERHTDLPQVIGHELAVNPHLVELRSFVAIQDEAQDRWIGHLFSEPGSPQGDAASNKLGPASDWP
jgi:hypothetical protein